MLELVQSLLFRSETSMQTALVLFLQSSTPVQPRYIRCLRSTAGRISPRRRIGQPTIEESKPVFFQFITLLGNLGSAVLPQIALRRCR